MNKKSRAIIFIVLSLCLSLLLVITIQSSAKSIDVVLLIDASGSMAWKDRDPEGIRKQGAKLFVDLCENNDRIGIMDFSTEANIVFPLYEIFTPQDKIILKEKIDKIEAKGEFTDIVLALQTSLKEMSRARSDSIKAVIFLTDGEIDPDPCRDIFSPYNKDYLQEIKGASGDRKTISEIKEKYKATVAPISREILRNEVLPQYKENSIPVFTVAFGKGADVQVLKEIADYTVNEVGIRNYYFIEKASSLQAVFSEILEQLKKTREKITEEKVQFIGEEIVHKVNIDDFIKEINFKFIFERKIIPSDVQILLREPNGEIIDRKTVKEGVRHIFEEGYELYNVINPLPGTWEAVIKGEKDVKLDITISTWGRTDLKILIGDDKTEYSVGDSIPITASLQIEGSRITSQNFLKNLQFFTRVEDPDGNIKKFELYDDGVHKDKEQGDGIYGNIYTDTSISGDYIVKIVAQGITTETKKFNFTREAEYIVRVLPKKEVVPVAPIVEEEKKAKAKVDWIPILRKVLPYVFGVLLFLIIFLIIKGRFAKIHKPTPKEEKEGVEEKEDFIPPTESFIPSEPAPVPLVTLKLKDGDTATVGSRQLKDPSVGERNLIINRIGEEFFIHSEEGSLELNNKFVVEEKEVKEGDIIKIGELYFEVQLKPYENKFNLLGITEEEASLRLKEKK